MKKDDSTTCQVHYYVEMIHAIRYLPGIPTFASPQPSRNLGTVRMDEEALLNLRLITRPAMQTSPANVTIEASVAKGSCLEQFGIQQLVIELVGPLASWILSGLWYP